MYESVGCQKIKEGMLLYSKYIVYHAEFLTFFACIPARDPDAEGRGACFLYGVLLLYTLKIEHRVKHYVHHGDMKYTHEFHKISGVHRTSSSAPQNRGVSELLDFSKMLPVDNNLPFGIRWV
jgi:hypothetical protein